MENHNTDEYYYDWNTNHDVVYDKKINYFDETLRDGLQDTGVSQPTLEDKLEIITLMNQLGMDGVCLGFPAMDKKKAEEIGLMIKHIVNNKLNIKIACLGRTVESDIHAIAKLSDIYGVSIDAHLFIGSSPIRKLVENWDLKYIMSQAYDVINSARKLNMPVVFATEDTTRSKPEELENIYKTVIDAGVYRIGICDTVGYSTPDGVERIVHFFRNLIKSTNKHILIDWHGHNDRGLAVINGIRAFQCGVDRVHVTAFGIGERAGNTSAEQLIMNMDLDGVKTSNLNVLRQYCEKVSQACNFDIPHNYPIMGKKVFSTAAGIHAAAIIKAKKMKNDLLEDGIYSSVSAKRLGFTQEILIGPMSGKSNVEFFLSENGIVSNFLVEDILNEAKRKNKILTKEELTLICKRSGFMTNE